MEDAQQAQPLLGIPHRNSQHLLPRTLRRLSALLTLRPLLLASRPLRVVESLDYEVFQSQVQRKQLEAHKESKRHFYGYTGHTLAKFVVTVTTGVLVGIIAVTIAGVNDWLLDAKNDFLHAVLAPDTTASVWVAFYLQLTFSMACVLVAAVMVQSCAPTAAGAGVSLVMAALNGNDIPDLFRLRTLLVKIVGTVLGCSSGLPLGPEAPLVHIGAATAYVLTHLQYALWTKCSRTVDACISPSLSTKSEKDKSHIQQNGLVQQHSLNADATAPEHLYNDDHIVQPYQKAAKQLLPAPHSLENGVHGGTYACVPSTDGLWNPPSPSPYTLSTTCDHAQSVHQQGAPHPASEQRDVADAIGCNGAATVLDASAAQAVSALSTADVHQLGSGSVPMTTFAPDWSDTAADNVTAPSSTASYPCYIPEADMAADASAWSAQGVANGVSPLPPPLQGSALYHRHCSGDSSFGTPTSPSASPFLSARPDDAKSATGLRRRKVPNSEGQPTASMIVGTASVIAGDLVSNQDVREFVSAGASAGLAAAFGAPIGGVLFSMEEACSYWSRKVAWRCFICAAVGTFTIAQLHPKWQSGVLSFSRNLKTLNNGEWLIQLPLILVVAAAAGGLGALFNLLRRWLWRVRASRRRHTLRVIEALAAVTSFVIWMFITGRHFGHCKLLPQEWLADNYGLQSSCPSGQYNDLSTLYFSLPAETIRKIFSLAADINEVPHRCLNDGSCYFSISSLAIASATSLVGMAMASGLAVPGGLFTPSIMIGSSFGAMYGLLLLEYAPASWTIQPGLYAIVAATAVLGGVFRSSISLVVIVVEGTRGINFLFGIIIAVVVSNYIAHLIHYDGVYESELERDGNVFYLRPEPPHALRAMTAEQIMAHPVVGFSEVESLEHILRVLRDTTHNGFPVYARDSTCHSLGRTVSDMGEHSQSERSGERSQRRQEDVGGRLEGVILRSQLLVLLQEGAVCDDHGRYFKVLQGDVSKEEFELQLLDAMKNTPARSRTTTTLALRLRDSNAAQKPRDLHSLLPLERSPLDSMNGDVLATLPVPAGNQALRVPWLPPVGPPATGTSTPASPGAPSTSGRYLNLRPFMHEAPVSIRKQACAQRVHEVFMSLGLRHLCVTDGQNRVVGIITRKDLDRAAGRGWWRKNRIAPAAHKDDSRLAAGWRHWVKRGARADGRSQKGLSWKVDDAAADVSQSRPGSWMSWLPQTVQQPASSATLPAAQPVTNNVPAQDDQTLGGPASYGSVWSYMFGRGDTAPQQQPPSQHQHTAMPASDSNI